MSTGRPSGTLLNGPGTRKSIRLRPGLGPRFALAVAIAVGHYAMRMYRAGRRRRCGSITCRDVSYNSRKAEGVGSAGGDGSNEDDGRHAHRSNEGSSAHLSLGRLAVQLECMSRGIAARAAAAALTEAVAAASAPGGRLTAKYSADLSFSQAAGPPFV